MLAIDPVRVRELALLLRSVAAGSLDVEIDALQAGVLAELPTAAEQTRCREIDEELRLLANELIRRADIAEGFHIHSLPFDPRRRLLDSLFDAEGGQVEMTTPLAYQLLLDDVSHRAVPGPGPNPGADAFDSPVFTDAILRSIAGDPSVSPAVAAAARFVAESPSPLLRTEAWVGSGILHRTSSHDSHPLRELQTFLDRNDVLLRLTGPDGPPLADLHSDLDDAALRDLGIDPDHFHDLALPRNGHDLILSAIDHGTHNHSPLRARAFLETLPIHVVDGQSIDFRATHEHTVDQLYHAAVVDLGESEADFVTRGLMIAHLPETTTGYRNRLITNHYADSAVGINGETNGGLAPDHPGSGGNNWFHLGAVASDSVGAIIRGEERVFMVASIPVDVRQDFADGNQAIFHSFVEAQREALDGGTPSAPLLAEGFDLLDQAAAAEDPVDRQHLLLASTAAFAVAEQTIVDPYLQLDGTGWFEAGGTWIASTILGNPRSMSEVMTDEAELSVQIDGTDLIDPIAVGEEIPRPEQPNHAIDPERLTELLPEGFDWTIEQAEVWADLDERMPIIVDVAELTLNEPALADFVEHRRGGDLDSAEAWFSPLPD